jgi:hypothetical protein
MTDRPAGALLQRSPPLLRSGWTNLGGKYAEKYIRYEAEQDIGQGS